MARYQCDQTTQSLLEPNPTDAITDTNSTEAEEVLVGNRMVMTPETKAQVMQLIDAGHSGAAIAKAVGISLPSVMNIQKQSGLVKKRVV